MRSQSFESYWFDLPCVRFLSVFLHHVLAIKNYLPVYLMIPCNYCNNPEPVAQIGLYHVLCMLSQVTTLIFNCLI